MTTATLAEGYTADSATAYERVRDALGDMGMTTHEQQGNRLSAQCPAHDDRNPSLSVTGIEGSVLLYCHGGCHLDDVLAALGLSRRDLYDHRRGAVHPYPDGRVVHRSPEKKFRQSGNTKGTSLYRVDGVRAAAQAGQTVYVVEGEKDVLALETVGAVATCSAMGAGAAHKADWSPLAGADVVIVYDRDAAGTTHAADVYRLVVAAGATSASAAVALVGNDAADHVAAGCELADLVPVPFVGERSTHTVVPDTSGVSGDDQWDDVAPLTTELPDLSDPPHRTAGIVWDMATAAATELQVRRDLVLLPMLGAISIAASGAWEVSVTRNWVEAGVLWTLSIAPPGSRKTGALDVAMQPLHSWEADVRGQEATDIDTNNSMRRKIMRQIEQAEKDDKAEVAQLRQLQEDLHDHPEQCPLRLTTGDATPEAIATMLNRQRGRIGVVSDEAGPLTTIAGRYSGSGSGAPVSVFNRAYDNKRMTVDRQSAPEIVVPRAALTITLAVQPGVLRSIAQKAPDLSTSGFMQRFLFAHVRPIDGPAEIAPPELPTRMAAQWTATLERLAKFSRRQPDPIAVGLTTKARDRFDAWRREFNSRCASGGDLVSDETMTEWLAKLPGKLLRLALLLWIADLAHADRLHDIKTAEEEGQQVMLDFKPMADAIALADSLIAHARAVLGRMQGRATETPTMTAEVWREITQLTGGNLESAHDDPAARAFRTRTLWQKLKRRAWLKDGGSKMLRGELLRLEEFGYLRAGRVEGSTAEAWVINPNLAASGDQVGS